MKKLLSIVISLWAITQISWAYDFAATNNGNTLFYKITNSSTHTVAVTFQRTTQPRYANLSGDVVIPSTVSNNGTTYTVTSIDEYAFFCCSSITKITIPESIASIGYCAFYNCTSLNTVNFNATNCTSVEYYSSGSIYNYPFESCTALTTLNIGNNVTRFPYRIFYNCSRLTGPLVFPESVSIIEGNAFYGCTSITEVHVHRTTPPVISYPFHYSNTPIYVPCGCMDAYYSSWSQYTNINEEFSYNLLVTSSNNSHGSVSITSVPNCTNTSATISSTANYGYQFDHWSNGETSNPYTFTVTKDTSLIAYFTPINYTISVNSDNTSLGTVSGGGTFPYGSQVTITATPNQGYRFTQWNDGDTSNPRTITVTGNNTYTAYFSDQYIVTVIANNQSMGTVAGGGTYTYNTSAIISATPFQGYEFTQWNDGSILNPRTITVTENVTYTAIFSPKNYIITVNSSDQSMGVALGSGTFPYNSQTTISATPNEGYEFTQWNDGNTSNPRTITVTGNATYTAQFSLKRYTINVISNNNTMGTTTGSGTYEYGTSVTISAEPNPGYAFSHWSDNSNSSRIRTVTVSGNATYTAYFVESQGIDDITADQVKIYSRGSEIVIEGADNSDAIIYDIMGRIVHKGRIESHIHVNNMGVYMVKIGNQAPKKVVVR